MNYNDSDPLMQEWLKRILDDAQVEWNLNVTSPCKLLQSTGRTLIWNLCQLMHVTEYGVPGQACRFIERYIGEQMRNISPLSLTQEERNAFKRHIVARLPLVMAAAILVSSKLYHDKPINIECVRAGFRTFGLSDQNLENKILKAEYLIIRAHNFHMPIWSSIETAELLAVYLYMPGIVLNVIGPMVNMAEFKRYHINIDLNQTAASNTCLGGNVILSLHLAAGAMYAAARYCNYEGPDPLPVLARVTQAPPIFITCVSDLILSYVSEDVSH